MNTLDTVTKNTLLHVLLDDLNEPAQFELPPVDPRMVQELWPVFQRRRGILPFAPDFRFVLCWVEPRIIDVGFMHKPTGSHFLLSVVLHPGTEANAWWYVLTAHMGLEKKYSYGPAPRGFAWAGAALPGNSLDACLTNGANLFFVLPAITSTLLHWAANQN